MDDDDLALASAALPNFSTTPASSSNGGQVQPTTSPSAIANDPIQQFDPWQQQGGAKKRAYGGAPANPTPPAVTQEELA
eukprot:12407972-Karenia_brevis.AAC.1